MGWLSKAALFGLLTGVVGLVVTLTPFGLDLEEHVGLEVLFRLRGERPAPSDVVIVSIDKTSTTLLNLPDDPDGWPRSLYANLTERLASAGAVVIAFDIIFDKARAAADDQAFAAAVRQAGNVVLFESLRREIPSLPGEADTGAGTLHIERLVPPIPPLAEAARAVAPFPLPKVPVKVSQYWTFKTGASDTPTLPVVAFQIFALEAYDELVRFLAQVRPSRAAQLPQNQAVLMHTIGVAEGIRRLREIFTDEPLLAQRLLKEPQPAGARPADRQKSRQLTALIRMYQSTNSQFLNFYGRPGTG